MNPTNYINQSASRFPIDLNEDQNQYHHQFYCPPPYPQASSSSSSLTCHNTFLSSNIQDQSAYHEQHHQKDDNGCVLQGGSYDPNRESDNNGLKLSFLKSSSEDRNENPSNNNGNNISTPVNNKWATPKIKLTQKMNRKPDPSTSIMPSKFPNPNNHHPPSPYSETTDNSSNSSSNTSSIPIRVCSDCNTTKTPLWRSGPRGPKSLCNACGIRQRKARRAMAAAAAAANGTVISAQAAAVVSPAGKTKVQHKDKIIKSNCHYKKRCKFAAAAAAVAGPSLDDHGGKKNNNNNNNNKLCFEDFLLNLTENLSFNRVFPQDEKEAAILLMALSCGLVHGIS